MLHADTIGEKPTGVKRVKKSILAGVPTGGVVSLQVRMEAQSHKKSLYILRENIRKLLTARKEEQKTLAEYCGHDKSWMNKFLNEGRGIRVGDFDRIASFFGIDPYQLFQPGISTLTERRLAGDRRIGRDRRIGHQGRHLAGLRAELDKRPAIGAAHGSNIATRPSASPPEVERIMAAAARQLEAFYAGQQAAMARPPRARVSKRRRDLRESNSKKGTPVK